MMNAALKNYCVVLGSQSPRRKELLQSLGIPFKMASLSVEELYPKNLKAEEITEYLCKLKAEAYPFEEEKEILITSDTIVWFNDTPLGKPKSRGEAIAMLTQLSNAVHEVITSVCLKSRDKEVIFTDKAKVYFSCLTKQEILYYIDNFKPFDKAGSYGIQEWIGYIGIERIEGNFYTIMGLPTQKIYENLKLFF